MRPGCGLRRRPGLPCGRAWRRARQAFAWWVARLRRCIDLTDLVRIDHFRGFESAWHIPADAETDSSSIPFRILYVDALFALDRRTAGTQMLMKIKEAMPAHDLVLDRMERYGIED